MVEVLCEYCGHKACNEVKCIGSSDTTKSNDSNFEAKGTRISFNVTANEDINRNILKVCILLCSM